ncbi:CheR family methyltransferase [Dyella sp.]|jgi:two-component system CheB/CheR fusion protein|uniref:CheR family methyltransferase n=1 Tax=Dyella sp. TaxID=1869338 RepID=UPI002D799785|nr:CheR family methyltransferase [Dyella sp.]HET6433100.1 CheR family methyltransferase [Dyella sp.]
MQDDIARTKALPDPEERGHLKKSDLEFPVVGIGASAGGLAAVQRLLEQFPKKPGMAFVVILHLSPKHESTADAILQRATDMPVSQVRAPVPLEKNHVYVISPRKQLSMNDGYLRLVDIERPRGRQVAIDYFFRALAHVHEERAVAVVLSGSGTDGSAGIARVRELGGITLAQSPDDAEYEEMPRAAIATGAVDIVLPAAEMAERILAAQGAARVVSQLVEPLEKGGAHKRAEGDELKRAERLVEEILAILRAHTGHDFRHYKRATILRRIERRMQVNGIKELAGYRDFLESTVNERPALLQDMLISVTNFFRDRDSFEALERLVVPQLFLARDGADTVRAWAAGCATGEEAYSIAMLLSEEAAKHRLGPATQVFATDIDHSAVTAARSGVYPASIIPDVPPSRLSRFFTKDGEAHFRVQKNVREKVLFAHHNLLQDPPFSKLDLITCRNLLIYLNREVQQDVLEMFHFALRPGGYLFLGSSESADAAARLFAVVDKKHRIYRAKETVRSISKSLNTSGLGSKPSPLTELRAPLPPKRNAQLSELHSRLIERFAPPSILLGADYAMLHMTESAGRYLRHVGGPPSFNLQALILPELRLALRTSVFKSQQEKRVVESQPVAVMRDGRRFFVSLSVRAVAPSDQGADDVSLVLFHEAEEGAVSVPVSSPADDPVVLQLEDELKRTKDQLQMTVEQSEISGEELKASNEELQSINEELRSATEELETSKEELQSMNEELITVNHELKVKVEETSKINDDLQNLIASTDIATVFIDRGMCIKRYTPRAIDIFSIIPSDIGRSLMDITHRLQYDELLNDAVETFQSLRTIEREVRSNDGRWYIARMLPYRTTEDRIEGAVLTFFDITGRRRAEEEARKSEEHIRLVAESTDHAIITFDLDGTITSWNKGAERIFGHAGADAIGSSGELIFTTEDQSHGAFLQQLGTARRNGRSLDECWYLRKDGSTVFCSGTTVPLKQGGLHGYAKIIHDATRDRYRAGERERLLEAEKATREAAQQASRLKDEFLATMSHELKHPLNLMLMNAELLSMLPEIKQNEAARRAASVVRSSILSQGKIIDDLLDLSRISTGKFALALGAVDLSESVRRLAAANGEEAGRRDISFEMKMPDEPVVVTADQVRIDQIIWNLLSNALKFTPAGGRVTLTLAVTDAQAVLAVRDNGRGITQDQLEQVFEMFHQGNSQANRDAGGLGIGLALVRQLVGLHGGTVEAASDGAGKGATFTVRLPLGARSPSEPESPAGNILQDLRILIVDDAVDILEPFRSVLEMMHARPTCVSSGAQALEALQREPFDVLLSDIGMPEMDGYALIRAVRALPQGETMTAIALTGYGRAQDQKQALDAGFDAHISKPVALEALLAALQRLRG